VIKNGNFGCRFLLSAVFAQFNFANVSCASLAFLRALVRFCRSLSLVKASAALSLACFKAFILVFAGVSGCIGLIVVISCMRIIVFIRLLESRLKRLLNVDA
jgi:hypothetical protein